MRCGSGRSISAGWGRFRTNLIVNEIARNRALAPVFIRQPAGLQATGWQRIGCAQRAVATRSRRETVRMRFDKFENCGILGKNNITRSQIWSAATISGRGNFCCKSHVLILAFLIVRRVEYTIWAGKSKYGFGKDPLRKVVSIQTDRKENPEHTRAYFLSSLQMRRKLKWPTLYFAQRWTSGPRTRR